MSCNPTATELLQAIARIREIVTATRQNLILSEDRKVVRVDDQNQQMLEDALVNVVRITELYPQGA